jgi:hypothetical protein
LAAQARAVAAEVTDPQARLTMLKIAESYQRLARRAEARHKGIEPSPEPIDLDPAEGDGLKPDRS